MKGLLCLALALALWLPVHDLNAATAQVRIYNYSVRVATGSASLFGLQYTLAFSSDSNSGAPNGELFPLWDQSLPSHSTTYFLDDPIFGETVSGQMVLDIPFGGDANQNNIPDFFEAGQPVNATTQGLFNDFLDDEGTVKAVWRRNAGSTTGTCKITLTSATYGALPEFTHVFEIISYEGQLNYTREGENLVKGDFALKQTGDDASLLGGPIDFMRVLTNRFNELELSTAALTNSAAQDLPLLDAYVTRSGNNSNSYFGFIDMVDGDPNTASADYYTWGLTIADINDADSNGIPDLSDDASVTPPPAPPVLNLAVVGGKLNFTITGSAGRTYTLEQTTAISSSLWTAAASVSLTNSVQTLVQPLPDAPLMFWRLRE